MKYKSPNQQGFLNSFFGEEEAVGSRKEINGFILVKTWNPALKESIIMIYTPESWEAAEGFLRITRGQKEKLL